MMIQLLPPELILKITLHLDANDRSSLAEVCKVCYQKINNGAIWQTLGLGDFVKGDQFWTMREIFRITPDISPIVINAAMIKFAMTIPTETNHRPAKTNLDETNPAKTNQTPFTETFVVRHLNATTGEWCILLELLKRGASIPKEKKFGSFYSLVENNARSKGVSDIYIVMHRKGLLSNPLGAYQGYMTAAEQGHDESLKVMLRDFGYPSIGDGLYYAARKGQLSTLKILTCQKGISSPDYAKALIFSAENGNLPIVEHLLQKGSVSETCKLEVINKAKVNGHIKVVDAVFQSIIHQTDVTECSLIMALDIALKDGKTEIVKGLLQNPNAKSKTWDIAFKEAAELGLTALVEYMEPYARSPYDYISKEAYHRAMQIAQDHHPQMIHLFSRKTYWSTMLKVTASIALILGCLNILVKR